ncbi:MAG: hypothetical protein EOP00_21205 [Pedobacter sp.]|nr:MAG: hypothetical protein EOP00_21205 [Pedobacter sp.]
MNTKFLMISSSIFMCLIGIGCTFAPEEILSRAGLQIQELSTLLIQVLGALYLSFAILNWTAKSNLIGGIYSKPVSLGNFLHFVLVTITLGKYYSNHLSDTLLIMPLTIYFVFAVAFGLVSFGRHEFYKKT